MKIIVKKLQGEECILEVQAGTVIGDIKKEVASKLGISIEEQTLLLLGKALADELTVQSYPLIKDGTKLHLIVKKPDGLYEAAVKHYKKSGMADADATRSANELLKILKQKLYELSWDDVERLSLSCMEYDATTD